MTVTPEQVLLYVPNLVGYCRICFTGSALLLMIAFRQHWLAAISLYLASFVGDLFGGWI
jgi:phosphatidylglycerophosphate synthase